LEVSNHFLSAILGLEFFKEVGQEAVLLDHVVNGMVAFGLAKNGVKDVCGSHLCVGESFNSLTAASHRSRGSSRTSIPSRLNWAASLTNF